MDHDEMVRTASMCSLIVFIIISITLLVLIHQEASAAFGKQYEDIYQSSAKFAASDLNYAVIIDAGSSGSRLFVYKWPPHTGSAVQLLNISPLVNGLGKPVVKKVSPGLSSFGDIPENASDHMRPLLEFAAEYIPSGKIKETPLFIMATAGLRLIPTDQANAILEDLRTDLPKMFAFIVLPQQIEIIPGKWEGIYSWIAVNYVLKRFGQKDVDTPPASPSTTTSSSSNPGSEKPTRKRHKTVGMIDMGGGSMQIAFELNKPLPHTMEHLGVELNLGFDDTSHEHKYKVYVTTFLGFGANEASRRYADKLISLKSDLLSSTVRTDSKLSVSGNNSNDSDKDGNWAVKSIGSISDPCLPTKRIQPVENEDAKVVMTRRGTGNFEECLSSLKSLLSTGVSCQMSPCSMNGMHQPEINFESSEFYGFSEYWYSFDNVLGMGGKYNDQKFISAAKQFIFKSFCETKWQTILTRYKQNLYPRADPQRLQNQCFKSAWANVVLHEGFGFPRDYDKFITAQTIEGQEVQWTLGALLYKMRHFPLRDLQRLQQEGHPNPHIHSSSRSGWYWLWSSSSSQIVLLVCFCLVIVAAFRYAAILRRGFVASKSMPRSSSMLSYMMLDSHQSMPGLQIKNSDYVF